MNKRGVEVSGTLVAFVLALILLLVLIAIFVPGINKPFKKIMGIAEQADNCQTGLFSGRKCLATCESGKTIEVPGDWADCKKANLPYCCEPVSAT
jgi:hypothetical protein